MRNPRKILCSRNGLNSLLLFTFLLSGTLLESTDSYGIINGICIADGTAAPLETQLLGASVKIGFNLPKGVEIVCSGTVTGVKEVTTAAHCFSDQTGDAAYALQDLSRIVVEFHGSSQKIAVKSIASWSALPYSASHTPTYGKNWDGSDLAVLTLASAVPPGKGSIPLCNPAAITLTGEFWAAGYGYRGLAYVSEYRTETASLCYEQVSLYSLNAKAATAQPNSADMQKNEEVCNGDSGGGLFFRAGGAAGQLCLTGVVHSDDQNEEVQDSVEAYCRTPGAKQTFNRVFKNGKALFRYGPGASAIPSAPPGRSH